MSIEYPLLIHKFCDLVTLKNSTIFTRRLNFAALAAWLVASILMAIIALVWFGQDFRGYYAAARVVYTGGNPYDYRLVAPELLKITGRIGNNPYYYAPFFAWFIVPLSWLPYNIARGIWMLFNLCLWNFSLWQLANLFQWPKIGWRRWLIFLMATFIFAWITWRYEQTGIILFALLVGVLLALQKKNVILAGIFLAILLIKPNITLIPVFTISLFLLRRRNWMPVIIMGLTTIGLLIFSSILIPDLYHPFFEPGFGQGLFNVLDGPTQIVAPRINTTLQDWLKNFQVSGEMVSLITNLVILSGLAFLAIVSWKSESMIQIVVVAILVNFLITPYALQYDFPPLTIVLLWNLALARHAQRQWVRRTGVVITLFIVSVPFWEHPISDGYWIVIGLIVLTFVNWINTDKFQIPSNLLQTQQEILKGK